MRIKDCRDRVIQLKNTAQQPIGYAFMCSGGGTVDGRVVSGAVEVIVGSSSAENIIIGGDYNTSLWGGGYASDTLYGGQGADVFCYATGDGNDVIMESNSLDKVLFFSPIDFYSMEVRSNSDLSIKTSTGELVVKNWSENGMNDFQLYDGSHYRLSNNNGTVTAQRTV